jgi:hypothetical protein
MKLSYSGMLYILLGLIIIIILYNLYSKYDNDIIDNYNDIENFESVIKKMKRNTKNNTLSKIKSVNRNKKSNSRSGKATFDDIVRDAENLHPEKYTVDSLKADFFNYIESFQKAKFENITGTTNEALDKFSFFKDKFFEIFQ